MHEALQKAANCLPAGGLGAGISNSLAKAAGQEKNRIMHVQVQARDRIFDQNVEVFCVDIVVLEFRNKRYKEVIKKQS